MNGNVWVILSLLMLAFIILLFQRFFMPELAAFQMLALGFIVYLLSSWIIPPQRYQFSVVLVK